MRSEKSMLGQVHAEVPTLVPWSADGAASLLHQTNEHGSWRTHTYLVGI